MKMVKDVLVPVNLKPLSQKALRTIKSLYESFDSHFELLHVVPESPFYVENAELLQEAISLRLNKIKDSLQSVGVNSATTNILHGAAYNSIIEHAHTENKNLILLDRENMGEDDGIDVTIDKVVRKALNPVWVVNPGENEHSGIKKIICAYDLSETSHRVVRNAMALTKAFSCELQLVHVIEKNYYDWWTQAAEQFDAFSKGETENAQKFLRQFAMNDLNAKEVYLSGKPYEEIINYVSKEQPDLVIIGTRGQSSLKTLITGSVSEHVISRVQTPFLTMKEQNVFEVPSRTLVENEFGISELLTRARQLKKAGFFEEAIVYLKRYLQSPRKNMSAYDEIAECYRALEMDDKADAYLNEAKHIKQKLWHTKVEKEIRTKHIRRK
ncbi:MAG: universal stress protein [Deltaproteobacteria bacterium]|nr:universal stress protein [Deltaproteobacteria bacterium]MBN2674189.1 universal stress protein [Deltaproteobacteria bacterium]